MESNLSGTKTSPEKQNSIYLFSKLGLYIDGEKGATYRRLKILEMLSLVEKLLKEENEPNSDELKELESYRESLRDAPTSWANVAESAFIEIAGNSSLHIPEDELMALDFIGTFTEPDYDWTFDKMSLYLRKRK